MISLEWLWEEMTVEKLDWYFDTKDKHFPDEEDVTSFEVQNMGFMIQASTLHNWNDFRRAEW